MKKLTFMIAAMIMLAGCGQAPDAGEQSPIGQKTIQNVTDQLIEKHGDRHAERISRGVAQAASLWRSNDGSLQDFENFCLQSFIADPEELDMVFDRLAHNFEHLNGYMNRIMLELNRQIHEDRGPVHRIDQMFGAFSPAAHVSDDLYNNKIAFYIALNFPQYSLD